MLASEVRQRRLQLGLTQRDLGYLAGVGGTTVSRLERTGTARPATLAAIEKALAEREHQQEQARR